MRREAQAVSIVIPVFNEENYIGYCLDAIARQTVKPHEVLVIDNNSTDKSMEIARTYPFVKIIKEPKRGVLFARNTGFNAASGNIIGRIDADTVITPNWVAHVQKVFKASSVAAVTGPAGWYDMPVPERNARVDVFFKYPIFKLDKDFPFLFGTNMAIRKSAWDSVFNELCTNRKIHEDVDIAIHLYKRDMKIIYDPNLIVNCSSRRFDDTFKNFREYIRFYDHTYESHGLKTASIQIAKAIYTMGYIVLWPLRQSYDEVSRTRSLKRLLGPRNTARKHPMA